jgi:hypothetical protein
MSAFRRLLAVLLLGAQALVPTNAAAQEGFASTGGTVVTVDAPIVTITVTIDFVVNDVNAEGLQGTATEIAQSIMDYWNDGLDQFATDCLLYNLVVTINPVAESAARTITIDGHETYVTTPGHHVVAWGGNGPEAPWPETYDPYDADQTANPGEDYSTPYAHELWAVWSGHLQTSTDYAHEFGHLLGFGDDSRQSGLPIPGRQGTLMADGDRIDQPLADRLADIIAGSGQRVPECEVWEGSIHLQADQTLASGDTCAQTGDAQGELVVGTDGRISGTLDAVEVETCSFGFDRTRSGLSLELEGTASESALTLNHTGSTTTGYFTLGFFNPAGGLDPVPVPIIAPGVAEGSVTRQMPNDYTITLTFEFRCTTCEVPVG